MEKIFINDLSEGMTLESTFLCSHKALLTDKNGKPYLNLKFTDRTGTLEGRIWDKAPQLVRKFEKLDYVWVKGNVVSFQDHLQLNVISIDRLPLEKIDPSHFLPHTPKDIPQMYEDLLTLCREEMKNPWILKLILSILEDPQMGPAFQKSPAAKSNHHAWIGGLLEHVLNLCQLARDVLKHYPQINLDLVLAGMILHDFGKIEEIQWERFFEYSDRGRLIGHLIIGVEILLKKAGQIPDFPPQILMHLEHIVLSHHGQLDYGSPKEPMTLEAIVVHFLDNMDSKIQAFLDVLARESEGDSTWSSMNFVFKRPLYKRTQLDLEESLGKTKKENVLETRNPGPNSSPSASPHPKPKGKNKNIGMAPAKKRPPRGPLKTNLGDLLAQKLKEGS